MDYNSKSFSKFTGVIAAERIKMRRTRESDLDFVIEAENNPDNSRFIFVWPRENHITALTDPNFEHIIFEANSTGKPVGYAIVAGLQNPHQSVELMRFVITKKNQGFGKAALALIKKAAFEEWKANRLWLDVIDHNLIAQKTYTASGFTREGVLREAYIKDDNHLTVVIMSVLAREYLL